MKIDIADEWVPLCHLSVHGTFVNTDDIKSLVRTLAALDHLLVVSLNDDALELFALPMEVEAYG